eukprot:comp12663_c0_seq1/m.7738 comp12663_c0_seq1/g.7738  ORF comp12663_c0_seq1/g.7738 comp12663_c0_seq1/m.7738 type:complete len:477 (-) comp12663_c0_seq1:246-1676(-)
MADIKSFFDYVDAHADFYVKKLAEAVAVQSVSADPAKRPEVRRMGEIMKEWIEELGGHAFMVEPGTQTLLNGRTLELPPVVFGHFGLDPKKKTVCVYGHYDVQPALKSDGWNTEPFELTEIDGKLFGRGSTDDKGPILCWLWVYKAFKELGRELPVNIKMCFEGMEETGSLGLDDVIYAQAKEGGFLADVDYFCISDNYWLGRTTPCLTYGTRGLAYFALEISGFKKDLHSGLYGGAVHEPMTDLVHLMARLVTPSGQILVPGINELVAPLSDAEAALYDKIDFDPESFRNDVGARGLIHSSKNDVLMARWRYPSLSLHGIEGAFYESGAKTVIPAKVIGKFSLRLVPDQTPEAVCQLVTSHLESEFKKLNSQNNMSVTMLSGGGYPWVSDFNHPNYLAGRKAVQTVHGVEPDLTREGGSIPITLTFEKATGKSVMLLPVGACDDGAHSQNEKFDRVNYLNGIKVLGVYLEEIARL